MNTKIKIFRLKSKDKLSVAMGLAAVILLFSALLSGSLPKYKIQNNSGNSSVFGGEVDVSTDKNKYAIGEKIKLHVKNKGASAIFFEPCSALGTFEKKNKNEWVLEDEDRAIAADDYGVGFDKKSGDMDCGVVLPQSGGGTYRLILPIFYECKGPSRYACKRSENFYSNEFEVAADQGAQQDK